VFDTNVLVSYIWGSTTMRRIMAAMRDKRVNPAVSPALIQEFKDVVSRPKIRKCLGQITPRVFLREYLVFAVCVKPTERILACPDPDDDIVLECAVEADADYIVTGDKPLAGLNNYKHIPILTPGRFLREVLQ